MDRRKFLTRAGLAGASATALAAPAIAQGVTEMVIVSSWPRDFPGLGISAQRLAANITKVSEGKIQTQYFAAGERVGAFDVFDEVASGNSQAYISAEYYWKGKHPAWAFFTSVPFGLTYTERSAWLKYMDGQDLWDELAGEFGLKGFPCGSTGCQMGGWFNKLIESPDDLKGLKMRIPGLGGDVMAKLGASPVSLPGGQIYENLVSGAIEATEWVGPYNDYFMKFYEAAKYYYTPGFHEPGGNTAMTMNASWWSERTDWEKAVLKTCAMEEQANMMDELNARNGEYLARMITDHGVELQEYSDDIYEAFGEATEAVFEETRGHSAMAAKIYDSFVNARNLTGNWMAISDVSYSAKRNAVLGIG